ncbi:DUF3667 domain-containing protein [Lacibacter luteus]|uniref:DUF3667 domain-containing protein n=1 Tax=Lacibacter luteus TaxID=2508719 RepID=A0A4Q1CHA1_9BACT|nr:DUF3667 domain-containing protein [Lacibacter luteus]RXK59688.1 DUF3667 domain-containing protein [Lacibacter luteus]
MHQTCLNCETAYTGHFCNNCGQKETHRYTVGHVFHELVHVFTHADKGIFSFAWNIIKKPGIVALDLVEGRRKRYFNLFQYLLIIVGITTFLVTQTHLIEKTVITMSKGTSTVQSSELVKLQQSVAAFLQKYNNIFQLILIPLFAFFSWLFIGRSRKRNYAENIVLHAASSAQSNTFAIATTLLMLIGKTDTHFIVLSFLSLLVILYTFTVSYKQFFQLSWIKSLLLGLAVFACSYIVQTVLTAIATVAYLLLR